MASQESLETALSEARRFIKLGEDYLASRSESERKAKEAMRTIPGNHMSHYAESFPAKSGATRRASMDLTRSLAAYRNPQS